MPEEWVDEKMQELLQKYAWMNEYAMYEKIINDLAEHFNVSKEMAKYRLKELVYSDTRGVLNYINDYNRTEPKLLALSVGLSLEPDFSREFLKIGDYSFDKDTVVIDMIDIMLDTMYREPVEVWRNYFVSHGYNGII